ncbi:carbonic anhydrase [Quadrisphaera sp. DSM 44207]|uniref:carbonic anhydrase n=1 Tax=Quadrisphaera sp. DSM 44207 TaxID=1881057 RepID=UPI000880BA00|nr:carbonic anhydrase [Quadrisphaera sp. DSM 44207]SDQ69712.1 carbonic anhydrase [Quadrisphaera sp. DSM 44207]
MSDPTCTPAEAWARLLEGNARFVSDAASSADTSRARRAELSLGQRPFALIFGCSDSRVPAELVFDQGLGDLFVVRTAGHTLDAAVLGSVEFGVGVLGIPLVVVLGHEACGAVAATATALERGSVPGGYVRDVVERITPSLLAARRDGASTIDAYEAEHVRSTAALLADRSAVVAAAVAGGRCAVIGVTYPLVDGRAHLVDAVGDVGAEPAPGATQDAGRDAAQDAAQAAAPA